MKKMEQNNRQRQRALRTLALGSCCRFILVSPEFCVTSILFSLWISFNQNVREIRFGSRGIRYFFFRLLVQLFWSERLAPRTPVTATFGAIRIIVSVWNFIRLYGAMMGSRNLMLGPVGTSYPTYLDHLEPMFRFFLTLKVSHIRKKWMTLRGKWICCSSG